MENSLANTTIIFMNYLLKELRNYQRKLFLCPQKNKRKRNQHFQLLFFTIDLHFVTSNDVHIQKAKLAYHKQYLFGLLTSRNAKSTQTDQSILHVFLLCLKKMTHKPLKAAAAKTLNLLR